MQRVQEWMGWKGDDVRSVVEGKQMYSRVTRDDCTLVKRCSEVGVASSTTTMATASGDNSNACAINFEVCDVVCGRHTDVQGG
jgi:hypothetical protein